MFEATSKFYIIELANSLIIIKNHNIVFRNERNIREITISYLAFTNLWIIEYNTINAVIYHQITKRILVFIYSLCVIPVVKEI